MEVCDNFRQITLNSCPENFIITAALTANTDYAWELKNKFNRKISDTGTTDNDGVLTVAVEDPLSKDLFHDFSGAWELRLYSFDDDNNRVALQFCDQYDYLVLVFEDITPVPDPNNATIDLC